MPEQQASTSRQNASDRSGLLVGLVVVGLLVLIVVTISAWVNDARESNGYAVVPDTAETLMFDGWLWGNPEVSDGVATYTERLQRLPMDQPWPPYFDASKNETEVTLDGRPFVRCASNAQIAELPTVSVSCFEDTKVSGRMKSLG